MCCDQCYLNVLISVVVLGVNSEEATSAEVAELLRSGETQVDCDSEGITLY